MKSHEMELDARAFGFAAGAVAALLFTVCALAVAVAPAWTTRIASAAIHIDLSGMARGITWGTFFSGLFFWAVGTSLVFASAAGLYNRFRAPLPAVAPRDVAAHRLA